MTHSADCHSGREKPQSTDIKYPNGNAVFNDVNHRAQCQLNVSDNALAVAGRNKKTEVSSSVVPSNATNVGPIHLTLIHS